MRRPRNGAHRLHDEARSQQSVFTRDWRSRILAHREDVANLWANFNQSIDKHARLRERRNPRTRSLRALGHAAALVLPA